MSIARKRCCPGVWSPRQQHQSASVRREQHQNRCLLLPDERTNPKNGANRRTQSITYLRHFRGGFNIKKVRNMRHYRLNHLLHSNICVSHMKVSIGLLVDPKGFTKFSSGCKDAHQSVYRPRIFVYLLRLSPCLGHTRIPFKSPAYCSQTGESQPPCQFWPVVVPEVTTIPAHTDVISRTGRDKSQIFALRARA